MNEISVNRLPCGLVLVCERISGVRSLGLSWLVPAGAARDPGEAVGLSALWEEMVQRGAGDLDSRAHADALDTLGVSRSVSVGTFHHSYSATMLGENFGAAMPLLADMVRSPRFAEADLEPSRDLCLQALDSLADDPQERVIVELRSRHAREPINRSSYGTREGLERASLDQVRQGWAERARPEGSILALAGDVDPDRAAEQLNTLFQGWEGAAPGIEMTDTTDRGAHHLDDETNQCHIAIAWDSPTESDPACWLERTATAVLSGGMSGRLFTEVREKRALCYSVWASYGADKDYGRSVAYSGTTPERAQETLDVLLGELERINTSAGTVTQSEFDRAIVGMKSRLVMSGESTSARASALAADVRKIGRARTLEELASNVDAVTLEGVNDYLSARSLGEITVCTLGPSALELKR